MLKLNTFNYDEARKLEIIAFNEMRKAFSEGDEQLGNLLLTLKGNYQQIQDRLKICNNHIKMTERLMNENTELIKDIKEYKNDRQDQ